MMNWTTRRDPSGFAIRWNDEWAGRNLAEGWWQPTTLVNTARAAVADGPDRLLVIEGANRLTRADAWDQALKLAGYFISKGFRPGDVIAFQLPNWAESVVLALASRMCGLIIVPIPPIFRDAEIRYILADCGARMIFVPKIFRKYDHLAMMERVLPQLPKLTEVVVVRGEGAIAWQDVMAGNPASEANLPVIDPASVMLVMYTSGTTGRPKGVMHTHYSYDHRAKAMVDAWHVGPDDMIFMPSPVTHIGGAFWCFDIPWISGACALMMDVWAADEGVNLIETNRCTISGGATPFLQQMLDSAKGAPERVASLRLFFCGGTTVSPDLIKEASAAFPKALFFRVYGSTEMTTATLGIRNKRDTYMGAHTDGEIVPPVEMIVVDSNGATVAEGIEGEILARGPGLFAGYLNPADNAEVFREDGFFSMGDLGRIENGRYIVITGRKKDIIIRSGENISPKEVEDVLYNHKDIVDVAIVAMPSPATGEKGCAFVIPREGKLIDLTEIQRFLADAGLARQKFPEHLVLVDELPRVPSGKVKKDVLRIRASQIAEGGCK